MAARHPNKEIQAAVEYALSKGWRLTIGASHAWGRLWCPRQDRDGCRKSVWSTPRNPADHARLIRKAVDKCPHRTGGRG